MAGVIDNLRADLGAMLNQQIFWEGRTDLTQQVTDERFLFLSLSLFSFPPFLYVVLSCVLIYMYTCLYPWGCDDSECILSV